MGKVKKFVIEFDRKDRCYRPGEEVTGQVLINLKEEKKVKKLKMKLKGRSEVRYTEWTNNDGEMKLVKRKSKQKYFEQEKTLLEDDLLPVGESIFPFALRLPEEISTSYEGVNEENLQMNIRYYAKCKLDSKKGDHETLSMITVVNKVLIDDIPEVWEQKEAEDSKFICCLCCK